MSKALFLSVPSYDNVNNAISNEVRTAVEKVMNDPII